MNNQSMESGKIRGIVLFFIFGLALSTGAQANTTGELTPTAVTVTTAGGASWSPSAVGNVTAVDGNFNTLVLPASTTSDTIFLSGFNASIPAGASIDGIRLRGTMRLIGFGGGDQVSSTVGLQNGSVVGTPQSANLVNTGVFVSDTFGGPTDTFGQTWTVSQVNSPNFGFFTTFTSGAGGTADSEFASIEIFFTPGAFPVPASNTKAIAVTVAAFLAAGTMLIVLRRRLRGAA